MAHSSGATGNPRKRRSFQNIFVGERSEGRRRSAAALVWPWLIDEQPNKADTVAAIDSTPQLSSFLTHAHGAHSEALHAHYGAWVLSVALAALSGLIWGVGDFSGGKATQRAAVLPVVWVSKLLSLPLLVIYLVATYVPVTAIGLTWGALAGIAGVVGLVLFYRALAAGAMTVVAPVTGVTSAAIPVVVGLVAGERPSPSRLIGVGCALLAIALVSIAPHPPGHHQVVTRRLVAAALGAGVGFALFFILLAVAGRTAGGSAGLWPIVGSQISSLLIVALLLLMTRPGPWPRNATLRWTAVAGPCDMTANVLYLLATRGGDLSVVAPIAALYPVTTVILALIIEHERLRGIQLAGLTFAVAALVLVSR